MSGMIVRGRSSHGSHFIQESVLIRDGRCVARLQGRSHWEDQYPIYEAAYIAPGFVDLQVNGGFGVEVGDDPESICTLAARLPETGVTAFLPTIITSPPEFYPRAIAACEAAKDAPGARLLGLHMEGPFLSPDRHGAHRRDLIESADPRLLDLFLESDAVRLVTLAPERPGAREMIRKLTERGVLVSLGHTDATYEQFIAGVDAGARMATHLYNAMSLFQHRAPGAVGAALTDDRVSVGLIADGVHAHPASVNLAMRMKGTRGLIALVTDMMAAAGMPPGTYALGGQQVIVDGTSARLADDTLAGSLLTMDQAVRNIVAWTDTPLTHALDWASGAPARLIGFDNMGHFGMDAPADIVLLDDDLRVQMTIIGGEIAYQRGA